MCRTNSFSVPTPHSVLHWPYKKASEIQGKEKQKRRIDTQDSRRREIEDTQCMNAIVSAHSPASDAVFPLCLVPAHLLG